MDWGALLLGFWLGYLFGIFIMCLFQVVPDDPINQ